MTDATVLVSGAGGSACANVIDALRLAETRYRIVGVDASPLRLHLSQADVRMLVPRADDPGFATALRDVVTSQRCDLIHPQPDPDVLAVGAARHNLGGAATLLPEQEALRLVADKAACARRLHDAGVACPETVSLRSQADVNEMVSELLQRHERVWIRARVGAGARAALPVRTAQQAVAWIEWWEAERGLAASDFMASEMLPGREFAYQSVWLNGELIAGQARERVEYLYGHLTPSGQTSTPSVARTVCEPRVDDVAQRAIRAVEDTPQGVYCVDLKQDAAGTPRVTEINAGRFFTTSNFFAHAGLNMPDLLVRCALGEHPRPVGSSPLPPDLYWIRMVDMGYRLVAGNELEHFGRADH